MRKGRELRQRSPRCLGILEVTALERGGIRLSRRELCESVREQFHRHAIMCADCRRKIARGSARLVVHGSSRARCGALLMVVSMSKTMS